MVHGRHGRAALVLLSSMLTLSGTGLLAGGAAHAALAYPSTEACPGSMVTADAFDDVPVGTEVGQAADCLAELELAKGVGPRTFRPGGAVSRAQMVLFLARVADLGSPGPLDHAVDADGFRDLDLDQESEELADAVGLLLAAGVVTGRADGTFGPTAGVSRAQMALFLARLHDALGAAPLPAGAPAYDDLGGLSPEAVAAIGQVTEGGIAQGVGPRRFQPSAGVSRQQMALFLTRALQVEVSAGAVSSGYGYAGARPSIDSRFPQVRANARDQQESFAGIDLVTYELDGLEPDVDHTVTLLPADQVSGTFRAAVYTDADGDGRADPAPADGPATLVVPDPETGEDPPDGDAAPTVTLTASEDGTATVRVRGTGRAGAVRAAVYASDRGLLLRPDGTAEVPVGLGERVTYSDRAATDPPRLLSAVGRDDPSGDQVVLTYDKPVRRGGLYLLGQANVDGFVLPQELSPGGTTQVVLRVPYDLDGTGLDGYVLLIFASDVDGNELTTVEQYVDQQMTRPSP